MAPCKILIVEDESVVALDIKLQLEDVGYQVLGPVSSGEAALALASTCTPDLALMDIRLAGAMDGIEAAGMLVREHDVPVIFLTSHSDADTVHRAAETAPYGYLTKPFQIKELRAGIEVALTKARLERQLKESDRWFASTLQCVQDGVIVTELDARVRFLNPAAEKLTGWTSEEAVGQHVAKVIQFADTDGESDIQPNAAVKVLQNGGVIGVNHARKLKHPHEHHVPVDESAVLVEDKSGQRLGAVMVLRDVSVRLQQEAQLRDSERRFRDAFDHAPLGMALVSMDGQFLQVNDSLCKLLQSEASCLRTQNQSDLSHPDDKAHEAFRLHELIDGRVPLVQFEKRYLLADRTNPLWVLVSVSVMREGQQPTCYLYQVHDLTDQKRAAEQLAEVSEQRIKLAVLEQTNRAKSEFLSRASHEIRTPLNAVIGFAQLLQSSNIYEPEKTREFAQHILSAGNHLLSMVNDVLNLHQASEGALRLNMQRVDLSSIVDTAISLLSPMSAKHCVTFEQKVTPSTLVLADVTRLRQVLFNLISNAIKYNRQGGQVLFDSSVNAIGMVRLAVRDNGQGMTEEQLEHLFQPFDRLGQEHSKIEGVGLGLVVTRSLMEQMGGGIYFESVLGEGTSAIIELARA